MHQNLALINEIADLLNNARANSKPASFEDCNWSELTVDDVYTIQSRVAAKTGAIGAWKTGRANDTETPIYAPIFAEMVRSSPAEYRKQELRACGVELEIGFSIDSPLPPQGPEFENALRQCVRPVVTLELIDSRMQNFTEMPQAAKLADNLVNGGLVVGVPLDDWNDLRLEQAEVLLKANGNEIFSGNSNVPGGDAFLTLASMASVVRDHCGGLQPGQIVTTGTLSGCIFIEPGTQIEGRVAGLGSISFKYGI